MLTPEQDAAVVEWGTALRSGQYPQGKGELKVLDVHNKPIGYCCLGVAGELCAMAGVGVFVDGVFKIGGRRGTQFLPAAAAERFGLTPLDQNACAVMNDFGLSFTRVADVLDEWRTGTRSLVELVQSQFVNHPEHYNVERWLRREPDLALNP
jgi:hypothetical protein